MRRISAAFFMSLDGVVSSPHEWRLPVDEDTGRIMADGLAEVDAILLGRRTYLEFAEIWPAVGDADPMGRFFNRTDKYVASTTLSDVSGWAGSTLLVGDLHARVTELRAGPGGNIQVPGSPRLIWWLLGAGLLDEFTVMIQPVVVGAGDRLPPLGERVDLGRADGRLLDNGVVSMTYRMRRPAP